MAQRLVRVICKKCKVVDEHPDPYYLQALRVTPEDIAKSPIYKGAGCSQCQKTGFKGRIAVFEMFEMNNEIRELAFSKAPTTELRRAAKAGGMRTLMSDGRIKVLKGTTTPAEVVSIAQTESIMVD
jgi:type IV pilus assembly protein PilB